MDAVNALVTEYLRLDFSHYRKPELLPGQKGNTDSESSEKEDTNTLPSTFFNTCTNEYFIRKEAERHEARVRDWKKSKPDHKPEELAIFEVSSEKQMLTTLRAKGDSIWESLDFSTYNPSSVYLAAHIGVIENFHIQNESFYTALVAGIKKQRELKAENE
jgi:hypothetical protein